ncbi:DUF3811 domain-containing protein [Photobacterium leiognathi]|uniref:DUF3811 domain-containing protein n=1 Tax=Photobacterium leiognathi TaxID=553611 RepID=UPI002739EF5A|nr:DUF3811 domain-containing protein [Photobacterium leiognathi]
MIKSSTQALEIKSQLEIAEMTKGMPLTDAEKEQVIAETTEKLIAYKARMAEQRQAKIRKKREQKAEEGDSNWSWSNNTYRR